MVVGYRATIAILALSLVFCLTGCIRQAQFDSPLPPPQVASPLAWRVYMPFVATGEPNADATCFSNDKALAFYQLMRDDSRQQRTQLVCNPALVQAATKRAVGLATVDPWSHVDAAGVWPNTYARNAGCKLPTWYGTGNNIESLSAGTGDAGEAFASLARSPSHSRHIFGESDFFREQTQVGIGYAEGGAYGYYWVILTAVCG